MKAGNFMSVTPATNVQTFSCAEGIGITIQEGGNNRTARLDEDAGRKVTNDLAERLGGVVCWGPKRKPERGAEA